MKAAPFTFAALLIGLGVTHARQDATGRYTDRVDVERVVVDVRALDTKGHPLIGLNADDFRVKIGGKPVAIENSCRVTRAGSSHEPTSSPNRR